MTSGKSKPGESTEPESGMLVPAPGESASSVLRWQAGPAPIAQMALGSLPQILAELCGGLGCRVLFGPTEDLTGCVLRVYHADRSLAMFPRTTAELEEVLKWAMGPTVLQDIQTYGDETAPTERPRRSRLHR